MTKEKTFGIISTNPKIPILDYKTNFNEIEIGSLVEVPLGSRIVLGVVWREGDPQFQPENLKSIIRVVGTFKLNKEAMIFLKKAHTYTLSPIQAFLKMTVQNLAFHKKEHTEILFKNNSFSIKKLTQKQSDVVKILKKFPQKKASFKKISEEIKVSKSLISSMVSESILIKFEEIKKSDPIKAKFSKSLSESQKKASAIIRKDVSQTVFSPLLLFGVTGSGKTEVYLDAVSECINKGKQALILLPEISLTIDFIERIKKRYGVIPGEWHSRLSVSKRRHVYNEIVSGELKILVGARSAIFLPYKSLGLIVIDEEHDNSYKQEEVPIYNARDLAVLRGSLAHCSVVLSSATPSIETWHNFKIGKYKKIDLPERYGKVEQPCINLIDMNEEKLNRDTWISPLLTREIERALNRGEQVLLYLNRRGYAPISFCTQCKQSLSCKNCATKLVLHLKKNCYLCHICGSTESIDINCNECRDGSKLIPIGPGVERIYSEIRKLFPHKKSVVLSSDFFREKEKMSEVLEGIRSGENNIIIGTQLISKGYNFPLLKLVAVIDADMGLSAVDHRILEKSYQTIKQVIGRAGRFSDGSVAFLQTWLPEHAVFQALLHDTGEGFLETELQERKRAGAPPYGKLISIILSGFYEELLIEFGVDLRKQFNLLRLKNCEIFGPSLAPIPKIRKKIRVRLLIKTLNFEKLSQLEIREWLKKVIVPRGIYFSVDIDPYSFY